MYCWGCGDYFKRNLELIEREYGLIEGVIDINASKWGMNGICKCLSPNDVPQGSQVLITVENKKLVEEIREELSNYGFSEIRNERIVPQNEKLLMLCGTMDECQKMDFLLNKNHSDYFVGFYVTPFAEEIGINNIYDVPVISIFKAERLLKISTNISMLVIADNRGFDFSTRKIFDDETLNLESFFVAPKGILQKYFDEKEIFDENKIMIPYSKQLRVGVLQFIVTAKCNLNCKWCTHFAGLVEDDEYYSYSELEKDMIRAREIFEDIDFVDIWGGEALLCEFLPDALYKARELWKNANIDLGTNGLLILSMSDELIQAIKETNTHVIISMYPPTTFKLEEIADFLSKNAISFGRGVGRIRVDSFFARYSLGGHNNIEETYRDCESRYCTTIYKGKMSACYFPITARFYNSTFGEDFEVNDDVVDIHCPDIEKQEIIRKLRLPMQSCRYCSPLQNKPWEQSNRKVKNKYDWVIKE